MDMTTAFVFSYSSRSSQPCWIPLLLILTPFPHRQLLLTRVRVRLKKIYRSTDTTTTQIASPNMLKFRWSGRRVSMLCTPTTL
jgi:hypothetical protein